MEGFNNETSMMPTCQHLLGSVKPVNSYLLAPFYSINLRIIYLYYIIIGIVTPYSIIAATIIRSQVNSLYISSKLC